MSTHSSRPQTVTSLRDTWRQLMSSARSRAPRLRASLIGLALSATVQGLALACVLPIFQGLIPHKQWAMTWPWLVALSLLMLLSMLIRWWAMGFDYRGDMVQNTHELRSALGEQLRRIPLEKLQDKRAGEINATLLGGVDENLSYLLTVANIMANALITPLVVALVVLWVQWQIGVVLLCVFPLLIPLYRWRRPAYGRGMRMLAEANERVSADILEYTQGLAVLRAACCTGEKAQHLCDSFAYIEAVQTIGQKKGAKPNLMLSAVMEVAIVVVVFIGAGLVTQGSLESAIFAALMVLVVRFGEPLGVFILSTKMLDMVEASLHKITALMQIQPLAQQPSAQPTHYDVQFDNVHFSYSGSHKPVVEGVSVQFPARSLTALVGPSGSGKSTLTRLLMRHADPQVGSIAIGGVDVRAIEPVRLNALVSIVFQDVYLFDDTVLANIRMAKPEATDAEVEAAARAAHCHDFISRLPQGYLTRVGDIGSRLSGGERQRISIARAILKDAPIVILDEPTAALDTQSEVAVQAAIDALVKERTVIVIAHRLSTIVGADQIVVINEGRVAEQGTHASLLEQKGVYACMWQASESIKEWHGA
ncbi:ABC transporter ATP-binding protein [Paenalcaligenes sp. Me131]|uniref:ABC transporter ATP-binding protein n=1 Tax=Paenalcaligenes sp. Me131 TaxID=3392636 RepID=UPI003D2D60FE